MKDLLAFLWKGFIITLCLLPLALMFLITKGLIWISDSLLAKRK